MIRTRWVHSVEKYFRQHNLDFLGINSLGQNGPNKDCKQLSNDKSIMEDLFGLRKRQ